jgi:hypothetical protein
VSYAAPDDVQARAGRARIALGQANAPNTMEIEKFLEDVAAEIDAKLSAIGVTLPVTDAVVTNALRGVNADGALILALDATFPSSQSDKAADRLLDRTERRYMKVMKQIEDGTWPAIQGIISVSGSGSPQAKDFWSSDPTYGITTRTVERFTSTPDVLPGVEKGQSF